jgi:hypothetical protein
LQLGFELFFPLNIHFQLRNAVFLDLFDVGS